MIRLCGTVRHKGIMITSGLDGHIWNKIRCYETDEGKRRLMIMPVLIMAVIVFKMT